MKAPLLGFVLTLFAGTLTATESAYCWDVGSDPMRSLGCDLATAQASRDLNEVKRVVENAIATLGERVGIPEEPDEFHLVPAGLPRLDADQLEIAFVPYLEHLERNAWWQNRPSPDRLERPLRAVASILIGALAARRADAAAPERLLALAKSAGEYLLWTQSEAAHGLFPFPVSEHGQGRPFDVARRFLDQAARRGLLDQVIHNGWAIADLGDGGLQFDNGLAGIAVLELFRTTGEPHWLDSARRAADWAMKQPTVPNWNYNSFSVYLLAELYLETGEDHYLENAKEKARLGIYPGQLKSGPFRGRWFDPHNARLVYHYIIVRGLASLVAALPDGDPVRHPARQALASALEARNREIAEQGVSHPEIALEVLCHVERRVGLVRVSNAVQLQALTLTGRYAVARFLKGRPAVGPAAWGLWLERQRRLTPP